MTVETYVSNDYELEYTVDEYGRRRRRTEEEKKTIKLGMKFKDFLRDSSLSDDDKQQLRTISAEYAIACTALPESDVNHDYDSMRRSVLTYLVSDLPVAADEYELGLYKVSDENSDGVALAIDGRVLDASEVSLMYTLIKPSAEVLDRASADTAYCYVATASGDQAAEPLSGQTEPEEHPLSDPAEYDLDDFEPDQEPAIEDKRTLRDKLRPVTGGVARLLGWTAISLMSRRRLAAERETNYQKIAS